ncbi:unnamed protein product [Laminaria digitata]
MASIAGICNSALIKLGATTIMSLTEGSRNANLCLEQYDKLRDDVLRSHVWNFATRRTRLARLAAAPAFGFDHAYQMPADWLRTITVHDNDGGAGAVRYRIEGRRILTGADTIWLKYVARIDDANDMDASFREALAWKIAIDLAVPITQSTTALREAEEGFRRSLVKARSVDAIEDFPDTLPESDWVALRH